MSMHDDIYFEPARLLPKGISYICPCCNTAKELDEGLEEDDSGEFRVPAHKRYIDCEECGQQIDIGWAGWKWHDEKGAA